MRVALVTPNNDVRDGALFIELSKACPDLRVFAPAGWDAGSWPSVVRLESVHTAGGNWTRQWMRGLETAVEAHEPDLIHVHNEPWAITTQSLVRGGRPVVIHGAENVLLSAPPAYRIRRVGMTSALRNAAGYVNWGATGLRAAETVGLPKSTPRIVIPASPPDPLLFPRAPLRAVDGELRVAFTGRLVQMKGMDDLLRGVALTSAPSRISLSVVGAGPEESRLHALAQRLGVRARFLGPLDAVGVHQVLADSDVLAVPSKDTRTGSEQWGRVVVEAMSTGRSVLVSSAGELPHLVDDPDCVFRPGDPGSLALALDALLADSSLVAARAEAAHRRAGAFRPDILANQLVAFWDQVLARWQLRNGMQ